MTPRHGGSYEFAAIDEATRYRVLKIYEHNRTHLAVDFIEDLRQRFPGAIQRIQTDHGSEFGTDVRWHLHDLGIPHRSIPRRCPESSGKVKRSHRTDAEECSRRVTFTSLAELRAKLRQWDAEYNQERPHLALKGATPANGSASSGSRVPQVSGGRVDLHT